MTGRLWLLPLLALLLVASAIGSFRVGAMPIGTLDTIQALLFGGNDASSPLSPAVISVVRDIRAPRVLTALLVGVALAVSGATLQSLFRNPLADPGLVGVSSGAALAAALSIVLGQRIPVLAGLGHFQLPLAAFVGGLFTTWLVYRLATREGRTDVMTMLLAGIAIGAVAQAGTGLLIFISDDFQLRTLTFWTMGSLATSSWQKLSMSAMLMLPALVYLMTQRHALDAMLLGEGEAWQLGFDVQQLKQRLVVCVALLVGAAVAITGIIGFIGLVTPHLVRLMIGPGHARLLPASAMLGGILLLLADNVARTLVAPAEMPIGILTSIVGGPFFIALLLQWRRSFTA
ncbi:MAG: iron ABC transporter [Gammaproteobacteria bacterium]|nr:MAG: iron ABC transporter [Gammaproteobacteria bacterium]